MKEMTSQERVFAALDQRRPDRIPFVEFLITPSVFRKACPTCSYLDFVDQIEMDAVIVNQCLSGSFIGSTIKWLDKEKGIFRDEWGVIQRFTKEPIPFPIEGPIKSDEDLKKYIPPDPSKHAVFKSLPKIVKQFKGKKALIWCGGGVFGRSHALRGMENLLMDYITNPKLVKRFVEICLGYYMELHRRLIKEGVDIIFLGDDYAYKSGLLMKREHFKKFVLPGLKLIVANIKKYGAYCIKHTDGNIWEAIDLIVNTGIDGIGPLEPGAGMDLSKVKEKYGKKVCVIGNIDVDLLSRGSVEEVVYATKKCIDRTSREGGHIICSGNSISSSVRLENFLAMIETTKKYGKYPIMKNIL